MPRCEHGKHYDVWCKSCDNEKQRTEFRALAVSALRKNRNCGDCYPENGWEEVNKALAMDALNKHYQNQPSNE